METSYIVSHQGKAYIARPGAEIDHSKKHGRLPAVVLHWATLEGGIICAAGEEDWAVRFDDVERLLTGG